MFKLRGNLSYLALILILLIMLEGGYAGFSLATSSYSTGYQGARAQFAGVYYNNTEYEGTQQGRFDTTLQFDPDHQALGMCDLEGEMTSVFIPAESLSNMPDFVPTDWISSASYIDNPREVYEWEIGGLAYTMEAWTLRWYISISANWQESSVWEGTVWGSGLGREEESRYTNTEVWLELDLTPVWYFEGATNAYFAIAKMQLAETTKLTAFDNNGEEVLPNKLTAITPDSRGSIMPLYYGLFAEQNPAEREPAYYQGKELNPDLFTSKLYTYVRLVNFGTTLWYETGAFLIDKVKMTKGDVATFAVDVTVFVIGEWTVQDIETLEEYEDYGRRAQVGVGGWSWESWLTTPANRLLLLLIVGMAVLLIIAILFPSVLVTLALIINSLTGGRRR